VAAALVGVGVVISATTLQHARHRERAPELAEAL
jgi:hypothetical protein